MKFPGLSGGPVRASRWCVVAVVLGAITVGGGRFAWALGADFPLDQLVRQTWGIHEGLPQSSVQAILQDSVGYVWVATQEGVARFDGARFTVVDTRSADPLPAGNVLCLLEDERGLWIGTRGGGLSLLDPNGAVTTWGTEAGLEGLQVRCLLSDGDGLLVGTRGGGLQRFDPASGRFSPPVDGIGSRLILDLARGPDGAVWVATEGAGLCRIEHGEVAHISERNDRPASLLARAVVVEEDGSVWVATYGAGLGCLRNGRWTWYTTADGLGSNRVTALHQDAAGTLWVGTADAGLRRLVEGRLESLPGDSPPARGTVYAIASDREGNLWAGTQAAGLHCLREGVFAQVGQEEGLPASMVRTIMEGRDGALWIGTSGGGLIRMSNGRFRSYGLEQGLPAEDVFSLYEDPRGRIWAGTYGGGLGRFEGGRIRSWGVADGLGNPTVWALTGDGGDGVWAGTFGSGLYRVTDSVVEHVGSDEGLPSDLVRCLRRTGAGDIWVGTANGMARLEGGRATVPESLKALEGMTVFDILETSEGVLWIATNGDGLFRWDGKALTHLGLDQGLNDLVAFRMLDDGQGGVWMTSNRGIARALLADLEAVATGRSGRVEVQVFGLADGLATPECNGGSQPAGWLARDGRLWFPTPEGLAVVRPERAGLPVPTPVVVLETLQADGVSLETRDPRPLPAGTRELQVAYAGLSFVAPDQMRFRYRLSGLSDSWIDAGTQRKVVFSRLPPGRYTFTVQAKNQRGAWASPGAIVAFSIRPFLWETPAFWAASALALVLLGFAMAQVAAVRLRRRAAELRVLVEDRTRDLLKTTFELEEANTRLEELSRTDPLTGLANRRYFDEQAAVALREAEREKLWVSLLMVDVDRFKAYNDLYGHQDGDRCLRRIAEAMAGRFARPRDLVTRWGGEEFVVLLPGVGRALAEALAEELRLLVEGQQIAHEGMEDVGVVTVSIGTASMVPSPKRRLDDLLRAADGALYRAKELGRNRVVGAGELV